MINIFTALYCEAYPVIRYFKLNRNTEIKHFQVFENKDLGIVLAVTGTGSIKAAVAVSSIETFYGAGQNDFLINMGTCAEISSDVNTDSVGRIYLCNKITERTTGRTFYPDVLFRHGFPETEIISAERPVKRNQEENKVEIWTGYEKAGLFDMEAAAVYQAGAYFFEPHRMSFLKIVSDNGNPENVTSAGIEEMVNRNMENISKYILNLLDWSRNGNEQPAVMGETEKAWMDKVCEDMHCSAAMKSMLNQHVRYCFLAGIDCKAIMEEMYLQGKLPCGSKREGKLCFEELRKKLL